MSHQRSSRSIENRIEWTGTIQKAWNVTRRSNAEWLPLPEVMTPELILIKKVGKVYIPGGRNSRSEWVSGAMLSSWGPWVCE